MNRHDRRRNLLFGALGLLVIVVLGGSLWSTRDWVNRPFPGFFLYRNMIIGPDFLPSWTGARSDLRFLDRVVAVDGRPVREPAELYLAVRQSPPGTRFLYTVEKGGRLTDVQVPSMIFSFQDWLLSFGIYVLAAIVFLAIGAAPVYLRAPAPAAPQLCFMVVMIFLWFATTADFMTAQLLPKEIRALAFTLTPGAGIHLGLLLTVGKARGLLQRISVAAVYGLSLALGLSYSLAFYGAAEAWHASVRAGYGYSLLASVVFLWLLRRAIRQSRSPLDRSRLRVILAGAVVGFFLPTLGTALRAFFGSGIPHNFLLVLAVFFPLSVAYALLKYNLFDMSEVVKAGLSRLALTVVLWVVYLSVVSLLSVATGVYDREFLTPLLFAVLVVVIFNPLLRYLESAVSRYMYGRDYDPALLQAEVGLLLRSLERPEVTADRCLHLVGERMGIGGACLLFRLSDESGPVAASLNSAPEIDRIRGLNLIAWWLRHFGSRGEGISRAEVESDPGFAPNREEILEVFRRLRAELMIPITFARETLGLIAFGAKQPGRDYSVDDFRLLSGVAGQLALSFKNGMLYAESEKTKEEFRSLYNQSQVINQRLRDADRLKKEFVSNISHELRTPISAILGYAEILSNPEYRADPREVLDRLQSSGQDLSQIMHNLTDFSRMEAETLSISLQEVRLNEVLDSVAVMVQRLIKARPIRFRLEVEDSPDRIHTDPTKLQQILMHLLTNALKFTEQGEIAVRVETVKENDDPTLVITVSDTGIGISREDQGIIFDDFRQLDGSSTRRFGGTGLGLSLCRRLAESLGGRIAVDSEIGKGSIFNVVLPLRRAETFPLSGLRAA